MAGSYDNEAIVIFLFISTFFCWIKALKQESTLFGTIAAVYWFHMVTAWDYEHDTPAHSRPHAHGSVLSPPPRKGTLPGYVVGTLASMQVPFFGFQPVSTSEHMGALGVFGLLQIVAFTPFVRSHLPSTQFRSLLNVRLFVVDILRAVAFVGLMVKGTIAPCTRRFYSLWDTGYAKQ